MPRDVAEEWFEERQARKFEQRLWTLAERILGRFPLPSLVRRCASLPFEYKHDTEMLFIAVSHQLSELAEQGHDLNTFCVDEDETVSHHCELVPAGAPGDGPWQNERKRSLAATAQTTT